MPRRPRSHQLEGLSRSRLHQIFEAVGWTVEDIFEDYGEDILVRIFEEGSATPLMLFVQAKATDNSARLLRKKDGHLLCPIKAEHLDHWRQLQEPVILTLWDSKLDCTYWASVQQICERPTRQGAKRGITVHIPISRENQLNIGGLKEIRNLARSRYKRLQREQEAARALIEHLAEKFKIRVESTPESGILIIEDPKGGAEVIFTGKMAAILTKMAKMLKKSPEQIVDAGIELLLREMRDYEETGMLKVRDRKTGESSMQRMTWAQVRSHIESDLRSFDNHLEEELSLDDELS
jgi:Domain of unknown function (DUF4365)